MEISPGGPVDTKLPKKPQSVSDFSRFNNTPAILARGTRTVSPGTVLTLLDGCNIRNSDSIQATLIAKFDFNVKEPPSIYPYNKYLDLAEYLRATLFGEQSVAWGYEELGYRLTNVYFQTVAGQVVKMMAHVMGPQRGAKQFLRSISNALPWGIHEIKELRPNYLCYRKALVGGPPPVMLGILRASLEVSGAKLVRADYTVVSVEEDDILYEVEWA